MVIVGGGVMGVSIAFHLSEAGLSDVLVLDRGPLGSGSTSKAAGGVRAQFADELNIRLGHRSLELLADFEGRPGQAIDLARVGYLFALTNQRDVQEFEKAVELQNSLGVNSRLISAREAKALSPLLCTDDVLAAAWSPDDGTCSPDSVVLGYASAARGYGATIRTAVDVLAFDVSAGAIRGVVTDHGDVRTSTVICCAGAWSQSLAATAGVTLPVTPYRRQIVVTGPIPGLPDRIPMTIDFATSLYFHREGLGLLVGMSDPAEPAGFSTEVDPDFLELLATTAAGRAPSLLDAGVAHRWAGLYEVTPDRNALVGQSREVSGFFYACGFSGHGFLQGPAVGEVVRDLVLDRRPLIDVAPLGAERFAAQSSRPETYVV